MWKTWQEARVAGADEGDQFGEHARVVVVVVVLNSLEDMHIDF